MSLFSITIQGRRCTAQGKKMGVVRGRRERSAEDRCVREEQLHNVERPGEAGDERNHDVGFQRRRVAASLSALEAEDPDERPVQAGVPLATKRAPAAHSDLRPGDTVDGCPLPLET